MICNSCKTSYNVLSRLGSGSNCAYGAGGEAGGLIVDIGGGGKLCKIKSLQILDFQRLASLDPLFIYE